MIKGHVNLYKEESRLVGQCRSHVVSEHVNNVPGGDDLVSGVHYVQALVRPWAALVHHVQLVTVREDGARETVCLAMVGLRS